MLTGDHGEAFDHGLRKHLQVYDELTRVPFLVRWTLNGKFAFSDEILHLDIGPTIAAGLDRPVPDEWRGQSAPSEKERVSLQFNRDTRIDRLYISCRTSKYKYIQNYACSSGELVSEELYDLEADPDETVDRSKEFGEIVEQFTEEIETYFEETGLSPASLARATQASDSSDVSDEVNEKLSHLGYR
jgi:arylsulfatase A-like enzyme